MKKLILITLFISIMTSYAQNCILCSKQDLIDIGAQLSINSNDPERPTYVLKDEYGIWMYGLSAKHDMVLDLFYILDKKEYALAMVMVQNKHSVKISDTEWMDYFRGIPIKITLEYSDQYYFVYSTQIKY